uniref:Uncharacterized protein n=1 Tax=Arundo donax TaxID=35708 RepID=A0A0A9D0L0_ARUDO
MGPVAQHPAREAHLEPHGDDEQLLVQGEGERVPAAQGRDRAGVRAPDAAGQPDGRMDGAAEAPGDRGGRRTGAQAQHVHALPEHQRRQAVHHVRGAQARVAGVGVDRGARPRLRLHKFPQGPPGRRRQHPHQRRHRLHRGVRRHPLRQGQGAPRHLPHRRAHHHRHRLQLRQLRPRRVRPLPPRPHPRGHQGPRARRALQPARQGPLPPRQQEGAVPRRSLVPLRAAVVRPGARPSHWQAHLRVRQH